MFCLVCGGVFVLFGIVGEVRMILFVFLRWLAYKSGKKKCIEIEAGTLKVYRFF